MTHSFDVPAVTLEDLQNFHARHFPVYKPEPCSFEAPTNHSNEEYQEVYDDGLGYYADGVKRTLTDEQIHMFRHSEIQRALRKKETAKREAQEALAAKNAAKQEEHDRPSSDDRRDARSGQHQLQHMKKSKKRKQNPNGPRISKTSQKSAQGNQLGREAQLFQSQSQDFAAGRRIITYED
ncbi:hypothetical protein AAP_03134 [Ascosphaera apis ARSEF 7405]|uniref:Uncharacterized protein n=1 Tax=Ascosphaera apis ARSEF 7405 TaxID=392613 RepID=A0A167YYD2_9EURO|nr:hypothetical protein AAP_03134 [Ascosphaera apis ARSEF 7405]